jgi:ribose/xylose/arabinose/galactoside ABC-type transport system permease subunit
VLAYAAMGGLIQLRGLPSIVVTLGASFVWLGAAILVLPTPGGAPPAWLNALFATSPPIVPLPLVIAVALAAGLHLLLKRTAYGTVLRGIGGNPAAARRAGRSVLCGRMVAYGIAGLLGVIAGLALTGCTTSGDANLGSDMTLLSVAAVIIGGGTFSGGVVTPIGAVLGALILNLVGSVLSFLDVSSDWQIGAQGLLLLGTLGIRAVRRKARVAA